jgi:hypothetical protein
MLAFLLSVHLFSSSSSKKTEISPNDVSYLINVTAYCRDDDDNDDG